MEEKKSKWKGKTFGNTLPKKKVIAEKVEPVVVTNIEESFETIEKEEKKAVAKSTSKDFVLGKLSQELSSITDEAGLKSFFKGDNRAGANKLFESKLKQLQAAKIEVVEATAKPTETVVESTKVAPVKEETSNVSKPKEGFEKTTFGKKKASTEKKETVLKQEEKEAKVKPASKEEIEPQERAPRPRKRIPIEEIPSSNIDSIVAEQEAQIDAFPEEEVEKVKEEISIKSDAPPVKIRLNKYLAKAGVCSRREADTLISRGEVLVNGKIVTEMGVKVLETDKVVHKGTELSLEQLRYVLLNKPKDSITTMEDTHDRRTVMDLVSDACEERIYPVGRLDRMTTGLLLLTNDGGLAKKLTHPSHEIKKIYVAELNKDIASSDIALLLKGIELEDGFAKFDTAVLDSKSTGNNVVIVSLHSGKNRVVRRMFAHLNYRVDKLDRISFSGITKGNLTRGSWRFLSIKEIGFLKMLK